MYLLARHKWSTLLVVLVGINVVLHWPKKGVPAQAMSQETQQIVSLRDEVASPLPPPPR